jgi:hypothetical protein
MYWTVLSAVCCLLFVVSCNPETAARDLHCIYRLYFHVTLSAVCFLLSIVCCLLNPASPRQRPETYRPSTRQTLSNGNSLYCLLSAACCLLFDVCCLLSAVCFLLSPATPRLLQGTSRPSTRHTLSCGNSLCCVLSAVCPLLRPATPRQRPGTWRVYIRLTL